MTEKVVLFSVIIPTFQRNDLLAKCLACLSPDQQYGMVLVDANMTRVTAALGFRGNSRLSSLTILTNKATIRNSDPDPTYLPSFEIIVADDGRTSTAEAMIRQCFPWVRWVQGPGTGPAANRNAGAAVARGRWLVFTDDDCLPQPLWLHAYWSAIAAHPSLLVFEGKTIPDRPRHSLAEHSPVGSQAGNLWSCNFCILRAQFELLGGFDSEYKTCMEDNDFAFRVRQSGLIFPFIEDALVVHPWRPRSLARDGWKSNSAELIDHLHFQCKFPDSLSVNPTRLLRLGLRIFWCNICFVCKRGDLIGLPFAFVDFIHTLRLVLTLRKFIKYDEKNF